MTKKFLTRSAFAMFAGMAALALSQLGATAHSQEAPAFQPADVGPAAAPDPVVSSRQEHARLGITLSDNAQGKVWIRAIDPNSGADEAGLRPNDQIVALDETKINTYLDVVRFINQKGASDDVAVYIRRNGRPGMLTASLGSEYANTSGGQIAEYPGNVRQRSFTRPVPPNVAPRAPGYVVPNTRGPYNR
jgi:S1-C subfamily serine protease